MSEPRYYASVKVSMIHDSYLKHVADPSGHLHSCKYVLMVLSERESNGHGDL